MNPDDLQKLMMMLQQQQQPRQMIQPQIPHMGRPSMMPQPEAQSPGYDPTRLAPGMTMEDIRGPQQPQMPPQLMDILKQKFMRGGATDIRNMGMGTGMGRMSMGGQMADPIRQMATQTGGQGLKRLIEMLRASQQAQGYGQGPLGGVSPMTRGMGIGQQPQQSRPY